MLNKIWKCKCGMVWSQWDDECSRCGCKKPSDGVYNPLNINNKTNNIKEN